MTIYDKIKMLRESAHMSQQELAHRVGYKTASAINKIEMGLRDINQTKVIAFANALDTTPGYLLGSDENPAGTSTVQVDNLIAMPVVRRLPLLGDIACGEPILATENLDGSVDTPEHIHADFALRCKGNSMINARIFDTDIVYIRQQPTVENGEIAAVLVENEATLKRVYMYNDHIVLQAENPQFKPLVYWGEEMNTVKILGKAVAFTSTIR